MSLEDLEREWNLRKRGRRKERLVLAAVIVVLVGLSAAGAFYLLSGGAPA